MSSDAVHLTTALATRPHTAALKEGAVVPRGFRLDFADVEPIIAAFRRMVRDLEFDVCELAPTTYLAAREAGVPLTAIPAFLTRRFHHGDIVCRPGSGIRTPKDLEGRRVGVRAYTVSTGVWARGILATEYGVDLDAITWVVDDEEHVTAVELPPNVVHTDEPIAEQFAAGRIDAALSGPAGIGRSGAPQAGWSIAGSGFDDARRASEAFFPLFPDAEAAEADWYRRTGIYPIHGLVAIRTDVTDAHPDLAASLMDAFVAAKERSGAVDTLPYGVPDNRPTLEALCDFTFDQHIVTARPSVDDLFQPVRR
ncbi:MAG TPA: PhnD/SsuA/transferrin family substrate-binding protein [Streptosporangiaceae bacterium]|jgi:4,5-dihydroxyphthalate decarboxylase